MIHVALASDERYLPHAAVSLRSMLLATADPSKVQPHLLHGPELPAADVDALRSMVKELGAELVPLVVESDQVEGLRTTNRFPPAIWYRTFLPELLPHAARVVYLDCDTLVLGDIADLAAVDLDGCAIGAVHNVSLGNDLDVARAGLPEGVRYFNSGVLVLDLAAWRQEGLAERVRAEARDRADAPFPDQDSLNAVLAHRRRPLSPQWNAQNTVWSLDYAEEVFGPAATEEARTNPLIVHFEGSRVDKPWHYLCKHPYRRAYLEHRAHTPWSTFDLEDRTLFNRLLKPFPRRVVGKVLRIRYARKIRRYARQQ